MAEAPAELLAGWSNGLEHRSRRLAPESMMPDRSLSNCRMKVKNAAMSPGVHSAINDAETYFALDLSAGASAAPLLEIR